MVTRRDILCENLTVKEGSGAVAMVGATGALSANEINAGATQLDGATGDITVAGRLHGVGLPVWKNWTKTYADFAIGAATNTLTLGQLSATKDCVVLDVIAKCGTAFAGGTASAAYAAAGHDDGAGDDDHYITGTDAGTDCFATGYKGVATANKGQGLDAKETSILPAGANVTGSMAAAGDNLDNLTQGSVTFYVRYYELP